MPSIEEKILSNPKYIELAAKQSRLRWFSATLFLVAYFVFVIACLNYPEVMSAKISQHSIVPIGIPISIVLFILQIMVTIYYARLESNQFAKIREEIIKEARS